MGFSLVAASGGYSLLRCVGFSLQWLLLLRSTGSRCAGFSSCVTQAQYMWHTGSRAQAQYLWHTGLAAPRHVGSSWMRARTRVSCIGRQILNHCATREVLYMILILQYIITLACAIVYFPSRPTKRFPWLTQRSIWIYVVKSNEISLETGKTEQNEA